jgi:hypothetical protein
MTILLIRLWRLAGIRDIQPLQHHPRGVEQPVEQCTDEEQRGESRRHRETILDLSERVAHRADGQRREHR